MPLTVMGSDLRTASLEVRDRLAFTARDLGPSLENLVRGERAIARQAVVLSTCHRTEIYALTADEGRRLADFLADRSGLSSADIEASNYLYRDTEAVNHLFRVAAGLDSAILGEAEVLGQVRHALQKAQDHRAAGSLLIRLFETALRVGKRVRSETAIAREPLSLSHVAVDLAERAAGDLSRLRLLVVGAGKVGEQAARYLAERRPGAVRILNRDPGRA
ncbi:MAG: glutamyl-tRNA reductase, partial [Anaerolineae bacterium]